MKPKTSRATRAETKPTDAEKAHEVHDRGVLIRGEAAKRDAQGKLPPEVTHDLVDGKPVRARYRAF